MGKILVFASVVISLATAGLGFVNKGKLGETKESLATSESNEAAAKKQVTETTAKLKTTSDTLATTTAEKEQAVAQVSQTKSELDKATSQVTELTSKATAAEGQVAQLTADLQAKTTELEAAKTASTGGTTTAAVDPETATKLAEQETLIAKLQSELDSTKSTTKVLVEEKQARVQQLMKKGTEGRVLAVNPAWNFVVLNLGDKNGVVNNAELLVKRGNRLLGKVRVTSVEPSTSIADIVANSMPEGTTITPGDNVIYQGNED